jgi:hypothetical protein
VDRAIGAGSYAIQQTPILIGLGRASSIAWASGQFRSKSGRANFLRGTADFEGDEHVEHAERSRHDDKKSVASTDRAWFRTNVLHACLPQFGRGGHVGMYRLIVRGETRIPSFTRSSAA